jgi:hypothetical protein
LYRIGIDIAHPEVHKGVGRHWEQIPLSLGITS